MIKEQYDIKTHVVTDKVLVSERRFCDICKKEITGSHWELTTGHNDWGNDSWESFKDYDICSVECLTEAFSQYAKVSNSPYNSRKFDVEHISGSGVKGDIKYEEVQENA